LKASEPPTHQVKFVPLILTQVPASTGAAADRFGLPTVQTRIGSCMVCPRQLVPMLFQVCSRSENAFTLNAR
jgi:hypothetical protein